MKDISIALLGAGYTLERTAAMLPRDHVVLTARSRERVLALRAAGYLAEELDISDAEKTRHFFSQYKNIETVVDSVPPAAGTANGPLHVVQALQERALPIRRVIYLSTTGVYGVDDGTSVDETRRLNPLHARAQLRVDAEAVYQASGFPCCCFRIAAIYGPGRGPGLSLKAGRYPYVEGGARWSNRIHVTDLARAIQAAISSNHELPPAVNLSDDQPALTRDVIEFYCAKFSLPFPQSISLQNARERGLDTLLSNQRVSNSLLKRTFSLELSYPSYKEGAGSEFVLPE